MKKLRGVLSLRKKCKKGQMRLSFGMIFSIILILAFLAFSVYAIQKFLGIQRSIQIGAFEGDLQTDVDKMWQGTQGSEEYKYKLPTRIKKVCFVDFNKPATGPDGMIYGDLKMGYSGYENMIFYPVGSGEGNDGTEIMHVDIEKSTAADNPLCFDGNGNVMIRVSMSPGDRLVTLSKE